MCVLFLFFLVYLLHTCSVVRRANRLRVVRLQDVVQLVDGVELREVVRYEIDSVRVLRLCGRLGLHLLQPIEAGTLDAALYAREQARQRR